MSSDTVNTEAFVAHLRETGIQLSAEEGNLRVKSPAGAFTPEIRNQLSARKAELLNYFAKPPNGQTESTWRIERASRERPLPLSSAEKGLWFAEQMNPGAAALNWSVAALLTGSLNVPALTRSVNAIIRRHEILRTTFALVDDQPVRVLHDAVNLEIAVRVLSDAPEEARQEEFWRQFYEFAESGFDLSQGPLLRVRLWRLSESEHVILILTHHIVSDGWSLGVIGRELGAFYRHFTQGEPADLPDLTIQYGDYAAWQRQWMEKADFGHNLAFWKDYLAGAPALLELPADKPRPPARSLGGGRVSKTVPKELLDRLEALGRQEGATLFMTLLAAFNVLLHRYSRQDDLVIGTPSANRARPELEPLIGFFVNVLPLRSRLTGEPAFRSYLQELRQSTLRAFARQDMPFEKLVEELHPERALNYTPLFQALFAFQKEWENSIQLGPDLLVTPFSMEKRGSQYDLSLYAEASHNGLYLSFEYSTDVFERETIRRMLQNFERLLEGIVADPDQRPSELPCLTPPERHQILFGFNATEREYPRERTVVSLIQEQSKRRPDAAAINFEGASLTYKQLEERSTQLARHLQTLGVGPVAQASSPAGSPGVPARSPLVGLCLKRGLDMLIAVLGVLKAGGAYVPLDPNFPSERLTYMLADSGANVLISQSDLGQSLFGTASVERVYIDRDAKLIATQSAESLPQQAGPSDRAYVLYTSGSTGRPKGVEIEHGALTNFLLSMQREPGLNEQDVLLAVTTLSFDIAGLELFLPLISGARIELASRETALDGLALSRLLRSSGATVMQATPATWRMLFDSGWAGESQLKALCGGEALGRDLAGRLVAACGSVWNLYGPTETTIWSSAGRVESEAVDIGRPIANTWIYVLDKQGQPAPRGVVGELWIGGAGVARGYLNRPELTAERFVKNPFHEGRMYRTGDLGRHLTDGRLECLGRIDQQVKLRGYRIELGEIESVLGEHPQVRECAVVARELGGEQRLIAYVAGPASEAESWREHLRGRLPEYMVPSVYVPLQSLPHTPNNKIDRKALPAPEGVELARPTEYVAPITDTEKAVAEIFEGVLSAQGIGLAHDFFDLGGHSLLATRVISRLRERFGIEVPLRAVFESPTVRGLSQHLDVILWTIKPVSNAATTPEGERMNMEI